MPETTRARWTANRISSMFTVSFGIFFIFFHFSPQIDFAAAVLVRVPDSVYSIEEEKMEIICIVKGTNPVLSWDYRESTQTQQKLYFN